MSRYRVCLVGGGRIAGLIEDEVVNYPACLLPYGHAPAYATIPEVEMVAVADQDEAKARVFAERFGLPRAYGDWRKMLETEQPDLVSICTPGTCHAEMTIFAANNGAKGIYCEKAFACSLQEGDAMIEAVERNNVKFNMGSIRRWHPGVNAAKALIDAGEIGQVTSVISYTTWSLLHSASHYLDLLLYFSGDSPGAWVQGTVTDPDFDPLPNRSEKDVSAVATIRFANGCWGHMLATPYVAEFEVAGTEGSIRAFNNTLQWSLRKREVIPGARYSEFLPAEFPEWPRESATARAIRDVLQAIETGGETHQGVRKAAMTAELAFGIIQSHRQGGARVDLPLTDRSYYMVSH